MKNKRLIEHKLNRSVNNSVESSVIKSTLSSLCLFYALLYSIAVNAHEKGFQQASMSSYIIDNAIDAPLSLISNQALMSAASSEVASEVTFTELTNERLKSGVEILNQLLTFKSDNLTQYALLQAPLPIQSFKDRPLIVFLHGYHPQPKNYGRIKDGSTYRPGDYYRNLTQAYTKQGFVVLTLDYRGHNDSQGEQFTQLKDAQLWYTRDTLHFINLVINSERFDNDNIFVVGHSMGASIGLYTSLLLKRRIKASSLWSMSDRTPLLPAFNIQDDKRISNGEKIGLVRLHHGKYDKTTKLENSQQAKNILQKHNIFEQLYVYETDDHLFKLDDFDRAINRDVSWFHSLIEN
ncbi:alpha/beta hydrolase family protein [Colwelliaceae bacterium BS250]